MRPQFDIEALRTMIVGVDRGSFARAAVELGRSQSAVSMQLKRLEEQAGKPLFWRRGRGLVPTEAGDMLLAYARRIVATHDEATLALGGAVAPPTIRLGLPQDFFDDIMPSALAAFAQDRPNVHVEVRAGRNYALEDEVKAGQLDAALAFAAADRPAGGELLARMPMVWLARREDAEQLRDRGGDALPLVLFDHPCLFRQTALRALDDAGVAWRLADDAEPAGRLGGAAVRARRDGADDLSNPGGCGCDRRGPAGLAGARAAAGAAGSRLGCGAGVGRSCAGDGEESVGS